MGIAIHTKGKIIHLVQHLNIGQHRQILFCQKIFAHGHGVHGEKVEIFHYASILRGSGDADEGNGAVAVDGILLRDLTVRNVEGLDQMALPVGVFEAHPPSEAENKFNKPGGKLRGIDIDHSRHCLKDRSRHSYPVKGSILVVNVDGTLASQTDGPGDISLKIGFRINALLL